uniref:Predicted protein n=1 Tax=Hordeum vulgare subsp. vulgare TaxID=112509 RepID=F2E9C0_HORVV|nr:predicted protein [Hordeum vulgare subsp. vulgare]
MATNGGQRGAVWKMCKDAAFTAVAGGAAGVGMILFLFLAESGTTRR